MTWLLMTTHEFLKHLSVSQLFWDFITWGFPCILGSGIGLCSLVCFAPNFIQYFFYSLFLPYYTLNYLPQIHYRHHSLLYVLSSFLARFNWQSCCTFQLQDTRTHQKQTDCLKVLVPQHQFHQKGPVATEFSRDCLHLAAWPWTTQEQATDIFRQCAKFRMKMPTVWS